MNNYATAEDISRMWRPLSPDEVEKADALISSASALLRYEAKKVHKDLDEMILWDEDLETIVKQVVVDVCSRAIEASSVDDGMTYATGYTESALGYSQSYTFSNPGSSVYVKKSELRKCGILRQRIGTIEL